jgi:hypothetical protein
MSSVPNSILLIGESDVGKTHYGAQLLKRLNKGDGRLRMHGAATNLEPFEAALECLNEGKSAGHTASSNFLDSIWPIIHADGRSAELVWPDYGGEQIKTMLSTRKIPSRWRDRAIAAPAWLLLLRLQQMRISEDIFSRPLSDFRNVRSEQGELQVSHQARLIELLQFLLYIRGANTSRPIQVPRLGILLTCWDELGTSDTPSDVLRQRLPMFFDFIESTWAGASVIGLSALERPLSPRERDSDYVTRGPEQFGYVILPSGDRSPDLTVPIEILLSDNP